MLSNFHLFLLFQVPGTPFLPSFFSYRIKDSPGISHNHFINSYYPIQQFCRLGKPILQMNKPIILTFLDSERSRLFSLQLFAVQVSSSGQQWVGRNYLGDPRGLSAHGVRRGFSGEQRGSQLVLFPGSRKRAEAEANSAAGDLVLGLQAINKCRWVGEQRWKNRHEKGYVWNGSSLGQLWSFAGRPEKSVILYCCLPQGRRGEWQLAYFLILLSLVSGQIIQLDLFITKRKPERGANR